MRNNDLGREHMRELQIVETLESEEQRNKYRDLLTEWYGEETNDERNHRRKREGRELESPIIERSINLATYHRRACFEDVIFSGNPSDLRELVTDGALSRVIQGLTPIQKIVLHNTIILRYTVTETAEELGTSSRNIRKLICTALYHIRGKMYPVIKLRRKWETTEKYRELLRSRGVYTTRMERSFLENADESVKQYYGEMTDGIDIPWGSGYICNS